MSGPISAYRIYARLRDDSELFRKVRVGEYGADIVWTDDLDMSNDTLRRSSLRPIVLALAATTMTAAAFRQWRERQSYTLDSAAKALGVSRRMIAYYENGERPIPRVVALATRALEAVH